MDCGNNENDNYRCFGNAPTRCEQPAKCEPVVKHTACPPPCPPPCSPPSCCPCPCPADKCQVTLQTVKKMVEAENKDIELSELLGGFTALEQLRPAKKIINKYDATTSKSNRDDPENNVDPQYLAYMMKMIENGLSMKTDPIEVYEHLFSKGNADAPLVKVGPTAAISTENMVVPLSAPTVINAMDPEMENGARLDRITPRLNAAVAEATAGIGELDDLQELLGGSRPAATADAAAQMDDGGRPRDMLLETRAPVQSAAVLRGSTAPAWFPGFNVALPDTALPAVAVDPEKVLDEAWLHSQPLSLELDGKSAKLIGS